MLSVLFSVLQRRRRDDDNGQTVDATQLTTYTRTLCCTGTVPAIILYSYNAHYLRTSPTCHFAQEEKSGGAQ